MRWHQQVTDGTGEPAQVPLAEAHLRVHTQDMENSLSQDTPHLSYDDKMSF